MLREVDQLDSVMEKISKMIADPYRSLDNCEDVLSLISQSDERFGMVSATPPASPGSTLGSRTASLRSVRLVKSHIRRLKLIHSTYSNSHLYLVCSECMNEHFARRTDCLKLVFQSSGVHIRPVFHVNSRFYHVFPAHPLPLQLSTSPLVLIWLPKEPQHGVVLGQHFSPL